jgi:hypothetical protein
MATTGNRVRRKEFVHNVATVSTASLEVLPYEPPHQSMIKDEEEESSSDEDDEDEDEDDYETDDIRKLSNTQTA